MGLSTMQTDNFARTESNCVFIYSSAMQKLLGSPHRALIVLA